MSISDKLYHEKKRNHNLRTQKREDNAYENHKESWHEVRQTLSPSKTKLINEIFSEIKEDHNVKLDVF